MKTMIVTGAGSGLGKELSLLFSQQGYHVLLTGRSADKLSTVKSEIEHAGATAEYVELNVQDESDILKKMDEFSKSYKIFGLVNNAGVGNFGPFSKITQQEISEMLNTNVLGTILMTKAVLPFLQEQGEGLLINIISTAGLRGKVNEAVYAASKFAVRGFTESLQKEYENSTIDIKAVYMGGMDTPFWEGGNHVTDTSRFRSAKEVAKMIIEQIDQEEIIIESKKS
ncbi:SDR family NAD(P)-dependent oxidoreductase [Neobacillus sp. 179-C4.2 HS]|uniref:SDR family NAD(P)-dependent oxidoreductase n=1 Tax=Neobacillus driksii TaxID=3035913 RepID=A0ABV4YXM7_9BACI|nr:SDR family NAD(P)-dependent oxidoreductase [Neobacillus sp. 179.-C4.2 HS]MDP5197491.1 SDR family NAD(P)-dependent oxidoreductase [Neobacillus sp. 179.-C4.2 HS]